MPKMLKNKRDIIQRKRTEEELKKKMRDLEKFHKFAVGRKPKIIELKKRTKELGARIGHGSKQ